MAIKLMNIVSYEHKITLLIDNNCWLKRLDTKLNKPTNINSIGVLKVVKSTNKKRLF